MAAENVQAIAREYLAGQRTWLLLGKYFLEQGYTLFPIQNSVLSSYQSSEHIVRQIREDEIPGLKNSPHCENAAEVTQILEEITRQRGG